MWPLQPLKKTFLDFYNSALGKNFSYREEKSIFFKAMKKEVLEDFFSPRGGKKKTKAGKEIGKRGKKEQIRNGDYANAKFHQDRSR